MPQQTRVSGVLPAALLFVSLASCQTLPTDAAKNFVSAANALAQAESDYFDQIQAASDESHALIAGAQYVGHGGSFQLPKHDDFSKAKQLRMAVMSQLQNYAQQIQAIITAAGGTWIADDAKTSETEVAKLLTDAEGLQISSGQAGLIQTAVKDLGQAIVNSITARELQRLSQEASKPIADIANFIAQDNANIEKNNFASGLVADETKSMLAILNFVYEDKRVNAAERYAALTRWMAWKPALITKATDIAAALKKLDQANLALAVNKKRDASALAAEASQLAQQASQAGAPSK